MTKTNIYLPPAVLAALHEHREATGQSVADQIRSLVIAEIKRRQRAEKRRA